MDIFVYHDAVSQPPLFTALLLSQAIIETIISLDNSFCTPLVSLVSAFLF